MRWVDVAGPPGVGKSTLMDDLWPPRCITWDEKPYPDDWKEFIEVTNELLNKIRKHPSISACKSMIERAFRKISTVSRMKKKKVYIQTGLFQRGLGIGWRLKDPEDIAPYFEAMPVSIGAVSLFADIETVKKRNVERGKDRSYMVEPMERPRQIAVEILSRRTPFIELDTTRPIDDSRADLLAFSNCAAQIDHLRAA